MRRLTLLLSFVLLAATCAKAEYVVLRNGQRLNVTGYQLAGDKYLLQLNGGVAEVLARDVMDIEPEEVFKTLAPGAGESVKKPFTELIRAAAARYSVDPDLISSVIAAESNFDPRAVSRRNARGLMQLVPQTAAQLGVQNIFDPKENIEGGTRYLRDLLQLYKNDLALALAAYNAGPERVQQYGRVPPFAETISYVRRVKRAYNRAKVVPRTGNTPSTRSANVAHR
jgi:soluble lytic murein transglycosylase-like protein